MKPYLIHVGIIFTCIKSTHILVEQVNSLIVIPKLYNLHRVVNLLLKYNPHSFAIYEHNITKMSLLWTKRYKKDKGYKGEAMNHCPNL